MKRIDWLRVVFYLLLLLAIFPMPSKCPYCHKPTGSWTVVTINLLGIGDYHKECIWGEKHFEQK